MIPEINLLPKQDRNAASRKRFVVLLGIVFALLFIVVGVQYVTVSKNLDKLQGEQQTLELRKTELETQVAALQAPEVADLATSVRFIESVSYPVSPLLLELQSYIPQNTYVRGYSFTEKAISFDVDFETIANVATFVGDVDGSANFKDVKVESISTFSTKNDVEEEKTTEFTEVERFANTFTVDIDPTYLRNGGVNQ